MPVPYHKSTPVLIYPLVFHWGESESFGLKKSLSFPAWILVFFTLKRSSELPDCPSTVAKVESPTFSIFGVLHCQTRRANPRRLEDRETWAILNPICSVNVEGDCGPEHLKPNKAHLFTQTVTVMAFLFLLQAPAPLPLLFLPYASLGVCSLFQPLGHSQSFHSFIFSRVPRLIVVELTKHTLCDDSLRILHDPRLVFMRLVQPFELSFEHFSFQFVSLNYI